MFEFKNVDHKLAFNNFVNQSGVSEKDKERISFFYVLALNETTREHINDLYNFRDNCVKETGLRKAWQTGESLRASKLAFNLYNGFDEFNDMTPVELFKDDYRYYLLYAVQIRFS